jgi:hypothetical protein
MKLGLAIEEGDTGEYSNEVSAALFFLCFPKKLRESPGRLRASCYFLKSGLICIKIEIKQ